MEFVEGIRIDQYCLQHNLNSQQVIELFIKVCSAISIAHRQLIIHRDLKPDNILVTENGEPKVLDFGIAKLLQKEPDSESSLATTINPFTPRYASPEQLQQENLGPGTDIYSLGVILYELLTGTSPYGEANSSPIVFSQKILESTPTRPSKLIAKKQKLSSYQRLASFFRSSSVSAATDIDHLLMTALAKSPDQRYTSVQQFQQDLQAYVDGKPVAARAPSWWYRASKFALRNKIATFITFLAVTVISVAIANNYRHLKEIERQYGLLMQQQEKIAEQDQQVSLQQQELVQQEAALEQERQRIAAINQEISAKNQLITQQRQRQANAKQQLDSLDSENEDLKQQVDQLAESAETRMERLFVATQQYLDVLETQFWRDKPRALGTLQQQQRDIERVFAANSQHQQALLLRLGGLYKALGFYQEADKIKESLGPALNINQDLSNNQRDSVDKVCQQQSLVGLNGFVKAHRQADLLSSMKISDRVNNFYLEIGIANCYLQFFETNRALEYLDKTMANYRQWIAWDDDRTAFANSIKAKALLNLYRFEQSNNLLQAAIAILESKLGPNHSQTLQAKHTLSQHQLALGHYSLSLQTINSLLEQVQQPTEFKQRLMLAKGKALYALEHYQEAQGSLQKAEQMGFNTNKPLIKTILIETFCQQGFFRQALSLLQELDSLTIEDSQIKIGLNEAWALYWELQGENENALDYYTQAMQLAENLYNKNDPKIIRLTVSIGKILFYRDRLRSAKRQFQQALDQANTVFPKNHPNTLAIFQKLSAVEAVMDNSGRFRDAIKWQQQALAAEGLDSKTSEAIVECYADMASVATETHSFLLDYWFLESGLFQAMADMPEIFDRRSNLSSNIYSSNNRANRQAIACYEALLKNNSFKGKRRAILYGQLGVLHLSLNQEEQSKNAINELEKYYSLNYGQNHPVRRFIKTRLFTL